MVYETTRSVLFYLNTQQRSGGSIGSPVFTFPNNLINLQPQAGESIRISLQEATINYTFYQTETYNNKFVVSETIEDANGDPQTFSRLVELKIGNYNLNTFILEITSKLNQNSLFSYVITFEADTNTLVYRASPKGNTIVSVVFDYNSDSSYAKGIIVDLEESCNEIMGFEIGSINTFNVDGGGRRLESNVPITMSPGVENLFVKVSNQCQNYGSDVLANTFSSSDILAKIPVASPPYSVLYFFDLNNNFSTVITNKYLDNLNIQLQNERFTPIEPRKDWTLTIKIDILQPRVESKMNEGIQELLQLTRLKFLKKSEKKSKDKEIKNVL